MEGPSESFKKSTIDVFQRSDAALQRELIPNLVKEFKLVKVKDGEDPYTQVQANKVYELKKPLTSSNADSCMNFDEQQTSLWADLVADASRATWRMCLAAQPARCRMGRLGQRSLASWRSSKPNELHPPAGCA